MWWFVLEYLKQQMLKISVEIWLNINGAYDMNIYCNDYLCLGVVSWG
jgi:hypothetical protein